MIEDVNLKLVWLGSYDYYCVFDSTDDLLNDSLEFDFTWVCKVVLSETMTHQAGFLRTIQRTPLCQFHNVVSFRKWQQLQSVTRKERLTSGNPKLSIDGFNQTEAFLAFDRSEQNVGTMRMNCSQFVRDE